jgi:prephenate dehydrogenase
MTGNKMKELGLIGYGNFGKFLKKYLSPYFNIFVYDKTGAGFYDVKTCLSKEIIILSIPVQNLEEFLSINGQYFNKNSVVVDVSSVKIKPLELMNKYLPPDVQIIGTHPLFGPNSVSPDDNNPGGMKGAKIVVCPLRSSLTGILTDFLKDKLGLEVVIRSPEEHDREMATVQALSHFISRALRTMDMNVTLKTRSFAKLYEMHEMLKCDTDGLFRTIENENPYAVKARREFIDELLRIHEDLEKKTAD